MSTTRRLAELTGPQVAATLTEDSIIVLPTGAIEHHGAHLPLVTDALMAEEIARAAVDRAAGEGVDVWILPTLTYTKSDEHHWAPGTMWLNADTLSRTLVDLGRSIAGTPARKLLFLNGHGGNVALLQVALRELRRRFGLQTFFSGVRVASGAGAVDEQGFGIHGGHGETSLVLHLRPDLVHMEHARRNVPSHLLETPNIGFNASTPVVFGWLSSDFGNDGVIGDPTGATAEAGAALFETAVAQAAESIAQIARFDPRFPEFR